MHATKFSFIISLLILLSGNTFAQGVFEGTGEESASNCVGDGCGVEYPNQEQSNESYQDPAQDAIQDSTNVAVADSSVQDSSAADSTKNNVIDMDDEEDSRDYFVTESKNDYQARKEGFSRRIQFGARVAAGTNMAFGDNDGWNLGVDVAGGIFARLPLTSSGLSVVSGLEFGYRHYSYDGKSDYGKNEATISQMLFDIPVLLQFAIDEDGLFFGLGTDIQLKMQGESEFKQTIDTKEVHAKDKRNNTLPTTGVEVGITADIGYSITSWCQVDVRGTFNFTNLLDQDVIAESALMGAKLHLLHLNAGVTFLL